MKHLFIRFLLFYLFFIGISPINAQHRKSANPILSGFHADPEPGLTSGSRTTGAQKNVCLPMRPSTR